MSQSRPTSRQLLAEKRARALLRRAQALGVAIERARPKHGHSPELWQQAARWLQAFGVGKG